MAVPQDCVPPVRLRAPVRRIVARFARLADLEAEAYLRAVLARGGGLATMVQRLRGLVVMCYYELPEVKVQLGYRPDAYIAAVSRRRVDRYGPEIRAGEAAVVARDLPAPAAGDPPRDQEN